MKNKCNCKSNTFLQKLSLVLLSKDTVRRNRRKQAKHCIREEKVVNWLF